jgi:hypothetical protein
MQPVLFADDPQFWYETQRALAHTAYAHTAYACADTGEVLVTAQPIDMAQARRPRKQSDV